MEATNKLVTELSLDSSKFKSELASAKASVSSFADSAKSLGVGLTAAFAAGAVAAASLGVALANNAEKLEAVAKNAERLGIATDAFQSLSYAAYLADTSMESVSSAISKMQRSIYAAQQGNEEMVKSFHALGLSVDAFKGKTPDQQFLLVKDAIAGTTDSTKQLALAQAILGRGATSVMNLLKADIIGLQAEYAQLGVSLSDAQEKAIGSANDSKKTLGVLWEGFANQVTADVAPAFELVVKSIIEVVKETGGIKNAAAGVASSIVSGVATMIEAYDKFLSVLTSVQNKLIDIANSAQIVDRATVTYNTLVQLASGNTDAAFDPRVVGFVGQSGDLAKTTYNDHSKLVSSLRAQSTSLEKTAYGDKIMDSFIAPMTRFTTALDAATSSLKNLKEVFGVDGKEGATYIKSRLGATESKQAISEEFDQVLQSIKESLTNGGGASLNEQLASLRTARDYAKQDASFTTLNQQIAGQTPDRVSFSGMDAAIKNIEQEINKMQGKDKQEVIVTLKVDEQGMIKAFTESAPAKDAVNRQIDAKTAAERAATR